MMHLLAIPNMIGAHLGGWRHSTAYDDPVMNLPRMIEYARLAERGKLDGLFLADGNGIRDMDKPALFAANFPSARPGVFDPVRMPGQRGHQHHRIEHAGPRGREIGGEQGRLVHVA
ncbi:MAG: hypothetical protein EOO66_14740, partial [Methylobacterium sp.]